MAIELRILTGARGGLLERFDQPIVALGRHLQSDLRFDPNTDLDVSAQHAEIIAAPNGAYLVRDSGSTNGTFVNGHRITGEQPLATGDIIWLGAEGPQVEVHLLAAELGSKATEPITPSTRVRPSGRRPSGERVSAAVRRETAGLRRMLALAIVLLIGSVGAAYWIGHRDARARVAELQLLLAKSDSATMRLQSRLAAAGDTTFASALRLQHAELAERVRATSATATRTQVDSLKEELRQRQLIQERFALLDLSMISVRNDPAVAFLVTELDGKPYGGTAFGVTAGGLLVTNKHNVRSPITGRAPTRLGVKYANTDVLLHAHVVRISSDTTADLALVQVDEPGTYPVVAGVARSLDDIRAGSPVVTIGFPHALDLPMQGNVVKTSLTAGTVSKLLPDLVQVDAYASHGSSGSPIFDAHGWVIGIIYGGDPQSSGRLTYAVPSSKLEPLLASVAPGVMKP
jgi:S1-C subfamily serine protease